MDPRAGPPGAPRLDAPLAPVRSMNASPAQNDERTNWTIRSTRGLSVGVRTRAGSITNPHDWAYSTNASSNLDSNGSAFETTGVRLSGTNTLNTPPKNRHAASHPAITVSVVCVKLSHTNMCRDTTAVKINA
ncbi:MAG: hypothetical protein QM733_04755 [Ilumatobacteraceae bacterium]